jgi:Tetratricopeptide repeat
VNARDALDGVAKLPLLRGQRPRVIGQRLVVAAALVWMGATLLLLGIQPLLQYGAMLGVALAAAVSGVGLWMRSGLVEHNVAVEMLIRGRLDDAEKPLVAFLRKPRLDQYVALALNNLGIIALRRGRFGEAVPLFRAAFVLERDRMLARDGSFAETARASLVLVLIGANDVEGARAALAEPEPPGALPQSRALLARSRALFAMRTGDPAGALAILESHRRVMQNTLTGNDAALAEVLEASALGALSEGAVGAGGRVPVDAEARAFVTHLLPGCEGVLTNEAA